MNTIVPKLATLQKKKKKEKCNNSKKMTTLKRMQEKGETAIFNIK